MHSSIRDRMVAGLGSAIIVALLGIALLFGLSAPFRVRQETSATLLDFVASPPPRPPVSKPRLERAKHSAAKAPASPPHLKSVATPVMAVQPIILPPPIVPPIVSAPIPETGAASSAGASQHRGTGQGAGGEGNGLGGGGDGEGDGGYTAPEQTKGNLKMSDLPADLRAAGEGGAVFVRYRVEVSGHVSGCVVVHSSGRSELDALTCRLIEDRFRFRPSLDPAGHAVSALVSETHNWVFDRHENAPDDDPGR